MLRKNQVVAFRYDTDTHEDKLRLGKVLSIRDIAKTPLADKTEARYNPRRSRYLVRCAMADHTVRSFYTDSVRGLRKVGIVRRFFLYCGGVHFGKATVNVDKMG